MRKSLLCAGPWIGEFGWELMRWQAHVRYRARQFDECCVACQPGHYYIYQDFAKHHIEHTWNKPGDCWHDGSKYVPRIWSSEHFTEMLQRNDYSSFEFMVPSKDHCEGTLEQEWHSYRSTNGSARVYDILIHARDRTLASNRNWGPGQWVELIRKLQDSYSVACIGSKEGAMGFGAVDDCRGIPLSELAATMSMGALVIGPSSGVHHFASLCSTNHLVWTDKNQWHLGGQKGTNRDRYTRVWNPFRTPAHIIDDYGWNPSVDVVYNKIKEIVK